MEDDNVGVIVNTAGVDFSNPTSRALCAESVKNGEYCVCIILSCSFVSLFLVAGDFVANAFFSNLFGLYTHHSVHSIHRYC